MVDQTPDIVIAPTPEPVFEPVPEPDLTPPVAAPKGSSLLDDLRATREEIAQRAVDGTDFLDLDVPGYHGRLFVRYHYPEGGWQRMRAIGAAAEKSNHPLAELFLHAGLLIAATQQILGRDEQGNVENPDPDDEILTFGKRLAALLLIEVPDTIEDRYVNRYILRQVFSPEQVRTGEYRGDPAISQHAVKVDAWIGSREGSTQEAFVGES